MIDFFSDKLMIGIHIRSHEPSQDWAVVPPMQSGEGHHAATFDDSAPVEDFIKVLIL